MKIGGIDFEEFKEMAAKYGMTVNKSKPGDRNVVYDKSGRGYTREEILGMIFEPFNDGHYCDFEVNDFSLFAA